MSKDLIIGIDLGTTNSEVAVLHNGKVTVIPDEQGHIILPSVVGVANDGSLLVGESAKNQYPLYPERGVKSIKRRMGTDATVEMAGQNYTPQDISAIILKRLKAIAEHHLGQPVSKAVITVPAYFNDAQRQATRQAGEIAGLEVVRIINEPTAAALAYEADHHGSKHILVYDLGGGTFDVSVVRIQDQVVEVLASHGNNHLGGDDFDQKLVDHLVRHLQTTHKVDAQTSRQAMARITRAAEIAKIALSDQPFFTIEEEYLLEHQGQPIHLSLEINRADYEGMIEPYINETLDAVHTALKGAKLTVADIDEILLVGGSTRTPLVSERLEQKFERQPRGEVNPDLCVAMGAAIQAGMIAGQEVSAVLVDITPYTFGTSVVGEIGGLLSLHRFAPIIHKNTPIPVTKSEVYYTMVDGQESVEVNIYQGEAIDAQDNILIGQFNIEGLSQSAPAGNEIVTRLSLDLNGVLQVSASEKKTGLEASITIDNALRHYDQAQLDTARSRISSLFTEEDIDYTEIEETTDSAAPKVSQVRDLIKKAEAVLDKATPEDREEMIDLIEILRDALNQGNTQNVGETMETLADIVYYLES